MVKLRKKAKEGVAKIDKSGFLQLPLNTSLNMVFLAFVVPLLITPNLMCINIISKKVKLSGVTIDRNLTINGPKSEQVLELMNGTIIKGSVIFKSGMGTVIKGEDSKIEGKVEGIESKPN